MMITKTMEEYYADCLKRNVISKERLLNFIIKREGCSLEDAEDIEYGALNHYESRL